MASLLTGATQQFTATAEMSDGSTSTTGFNWSVEGGGAVSVSGMYTAPSTSQETPATITATKSSKKGTATVVKVINQATIVSRGPITGKIGGNSTAFTTMFTATDSTYSDYDFVITPTSAGTINGSGVFTLNDDASGTVTVKATHKTQTSVTATTTFTGVAAKAGILSKGPITTAFVGGTQIAITVMFNFINSVPEDYDITVSPTANGSYGNGNIYLTDAASGSTVVKAIHKTQGNASETCTLTNVSPKATLSAKTVTGKIGGGTVTFAEMFTSNYTADKFNYVVTPSATATINTTTGLLTLSDNASDNYTVKATHKVQTSVTATANITGVAPKAGLSGMNFINKFGGDKIFFANSFNNFVNSTSSDYNYVVTPSAAATNVLADSFVLADSASGLVEITATHKTQTSVKAVTKLTDVAPKATISAKTVGAKVGGDVIPFADMFTSNNAATRFNYVVTPSDAGTVDSSGNLTLADDPGDEVITVKATHKSQISVTATCNITATPKLVGLFLTGVTNGEAVGDMELPSVDDAIYITDYTQEAVYRIEGVFRGALLGTIVYDVAGPGAAAMSVSISGELLTVSTSSELLGETTITLRTDPGSSVFRTYNVKTGAKP